MSRGGSWGHKCTPARQHADTTGCLVSYNVMPLPPVSALFPACLILLPPCRTGWCSPTRSGMQSTSGTSRPTRRCTQHSSRASMQRQASSSSSRVARRQRQMQQQRPMAVSGRCQRATTCTPLCHPPSCRLTLPTWRRMWTAWSRRVRAGQGGALRALGIDPHS